MLRKFCARFKRSLAAAGLAFMLTAWMAPVFAQNTLPLPQTGSYGGIVENNRANRAIDEVEGSYNFIEGVTLVIFSDENIRSTNVVLGAVAIVYLVVIGIRFIISEGNEEEIQTAQKHFGYVILGLFVISIAQVVAFTIFNPNQEVNPDFLTNVNVHLAVNAKAMQIKLFLQIIIGGIALLSIITSAYRILGSTGKEETINEEKQLLKNFFFATILILSAEILVRGVFYLPGQNREGVTNQAITIGIEEVMGLVTALLSIVAAASVLMLILASLYYVVSFGDEERAGRAKRLVINVLIAVVVIFSSYTILRFFF